MIESRPPNILSFFTPQKTEPWFAWRSGRLSVRDDCFIWGKQPWTWLRRIRRLPKQDGGWMYYG